jgi:signal transduction histidine kinase
MSHFNLRRWSRSQLGLLALLILLGVGAEVVLIATYIQTRAILPNYERASTIWSNLANVQRETLRLQITTQTFLEQPEDPAFEAIQLQRAILERHLAVTLRSTARHPDTAATLAGMDNLLDQYDRTVSQLRSDRSAELMAIAAPHLNNLLADLERRVKGAYDREELLYFEDVTSILRLQSDSEVILLTTSALLLISAVTLSLSIYRATSREFERVRRITELEATNKSLDEFAYVVSHDLKAPLRAITSLSEWIEDALGEHKSEEIAEYMTLLHRRVHRMEALINGILEYSRAGRSLAQLETVQVDELLAETIDSLAPPPKFVINVEPGMPTLVTERVKLGQVFGNLLSNAIKFHHRPNGRITITVQERDDSYEFAVSDDGPGIAPEYHEKVFAVFQTLQPRDTMESTGVGLAVVKKIVESQDGQVKLESAEGQGATFRFSWPKQPPAWRQEKHGNEK